MTIHRASTTVTLLTPTGTPYSDLDVIAVTWTPNEGAAPYLTGSVTIAAPSISNYALLDPDSVPFVQLASTADSNSVSYILRVYGRERQPDNTVVLTLVSAEQTLMDYSPGAVIHTYAGGSSTLYGSIISGVLSTVFPKWTRVTSSVTGADAPESGYYPYWSRTNLVPNPNIEHGLAPWVATNTNAKALASTTVAHRGSYSMSVTTASSSITTPDISAAIPLSLDAGATYLFNGWYYNGAAQTGTLDSRARSLSLVITVGGVAQTLQTSPAANNAGGVWQQVIMQVTMPAVFDSSGTYLRAYHGATTGTSYWDDISVIQITDPSLYDPELYLDGDITGDANYTFAWQGTAGQSASVRTPINARDPSSLTWQPGTTAYDFLNTIDQSMQYRLFSDGWQVVNGALAARFFWVTNRYAVAGTPVRAVDGSNLYSVNDRRNLADTFPDGTPVWADRVVLSYSWTDALGDHVVYDAYPTSGSSVKTYFVAYTTAFPGTGRAQQIYNRMQARASQLSVTMACDPTIIPGRQINITSTEVGGTVSAYIDDVTHDPLNGSTQVTTKQAVSVPTDAWANETGTWAAWTGTWATP